jgi:tRNA(Ile2) C34 agmatinyltransferase TiaS
MAVVVMDLYRWYCQKCGTGYMNGSGQSEYYKGVKYCRDCVRKLRDKDKKENK